MSDEIAYDAYNEDEQEILICEKDKVPLEPAQVTLSYLDASFPVILPTCPICHMVYISEELSNGKILSVEKSLEDK